MNLDISIPENKKKLTAVEIDLLEQFKSICEKYGLKYYACMGTLLGAVRHGGIIPWDDDIDVAMPATDYRQFIEIAARELHEPYFLQTTFSNRFAEAGIAKMRNSSTTGYSVWERDFVFDPEYNKGIYLDIFPLFDIPPTESLRAAQKEEVLHIWRAIEGWKASVSLTSEQIKVKPEYYEYLPVFYELNKQYSITEIKNRYYELCTFIGTGVEEIGFTSYRCHKQSMVWKKEWFDVTEELPFEHTTIRCPKAFDSILTKTYGDWRTPVQNTAYHEMAYIDVDTPYSEIADT